MSGLEFAESPVAGFALALAIGLIVGRTREPAEGSPPRPGIRDFLIIAMLGATAAHTGYLLITVVMFLATAAMLLLMRAQHPLRNGITTELAALVVFVLGYLCMTPLRAYASGLAIVLSMILARRNELRRFVREEISDSEYIETLSFLSLIFVIYPLLPQGGFGPYGFFEPRRIWMFVILVSGVSYVGYFLTKFSGPQRGPMLTAIVGALASTTAYTTGLARAVRDAPGSSIAAARTAIVANSIMFPRMLIIIAPVSPALAVAAAPAFIAMTLTGLVTAELICREPESGEAPTAGAAFRNPFSIKPALQFGVVFTIVLLMARAAQAYMGNLGQMTIAAISGLVDVDAISLTLAEFVQRSSTSARDAVIGMILAAGVNAIFKSAVAQSSGQSAFYLRLIAGFAVMFAAGAATVWAIDPARFASLLSAASA